ncbi:MAG: hypothetical protein OXG33_08075 [Chloroflexi bacterium]|nr:hypothetical protein [Chloroflexota bacterium]
MREDYFHRVQRETATRVWVNNPTEFDLSASVDAGAVSGTTNPTYGSVLLRREPEYVEPIIDEVAAVESNPYKAADEVYQRITRRFMEGFLPQWESSGGEWGFVTMQDDPRLDEDPDLIVDAALRHREVAPNYLAKIPVIESGMEAMRRLVGLNIPMCATECFAVSQAVAMCEVYEKAADATGNTPPFFITHITGVLDDDLSEWVAENEIDLAPELVRMAGSIVARRQYKVIKERGYRTVFLGGGVRGTHHYTEFVGGDAHITMNWSTFDDLIQEDGPVIDRIHFADDPADIAELRAKIPRFATAYDDDGLSTAEFTEYPALVRFRNYFIDGCVHLDDEIAKRHAAAAVV